ncbi:WD40-like Beta Propeller Repeat [Xylanibacter ruminicola]|uniref:WD40-like Beta Propeller Repeat n=1 Tax=Xylanibacter ruminicola TaxID=839 RepID=A0A1M6ST99_XYLRU|nr:WD40-like Beta Propeller Repeat [Xylanibacter ruminicola]
MAKMYSSIRNIVLSIGCWALVACSPTPTNVTKVNQTPEIYPDYVGVTIPVDIAPLNFAMADDAFATIDVEVKGTKGGSIHANGDYADFDVDEWHQLLKQNKGGALTFAVCAKKDGQWTGYQEFTVNVSDEPLEAWGITYRRIPPSYEMYSKMGLYQRNLSNFDEEALLVNTQTPNQCLNCHTANRTNPDQFVFHVRGNHGATAIGKNGIELLKAKNDSLGGSMVYPYWHPGGRYCAFSTNKTSQMFHTNMKNKRIEVYDSSSDVFVYDTETHTVLGDTIIMKKYWAENTPAFSPDGKWLYFTTAKRQIYPTDYDKEKYSLCRISFDEKTGKLGEQVDTLQSAESTGKSYTWPRPSYDGRYLMYTQTDFGYFSIWHPEADLWLLDLQTGETRPMTEVNSERTESWHNWNVNSRWFLFTSRRENGLYTQIYLSMLDKQGQATKPFLLPQRDPKRYYRELLYSFNTPDFTSKPVDYDSYQTAMKLSGKERVATKFQ